MPAQVALRDGNAEVPVVVRSPGILRVRATGLGGRAARSNPLVVLPQTPRILWADLHGHSNLSDGTGTAEDYFRYARDVAGLDVAVLTDHDHVGRRPLDATPEFWAEIRKQVAAFNDPGRFVTVLGFEWTSWIHGHRHVLYFDGDGAVISTADPAYTSPLQLWDALRGKRALTFAHHSAGGPIATNWAFPPDPVLEPVTEIVSVHGNSESPDAPQSGARAGRRQLRARRAAARLPARLRRQRRQPRRSSGSRVARQLGLRRSRRDPVGRSHARRCLRSAARTPRVRDERPVGSSCR